MFAARLPARSTAAAAPDSGLAAGDKVAVTGDVGQGTLDADDVDEIGRASLLELEGIFLRATEDGFDMAVVHRGLVHVTVRDGALTPTFRAGDQIEVIVRVGEDGSFTFVKGRQDERDYGKLKDRHEYRAEGVLAGKSPLSVSVRAEKGTLTCAIPAGLDLALFRLGEKAKLVCVSRDGDLVMVRLRTQHGEVRGDGSGELGVHGVLTALSPADVSVRREDTTLTTCSLASPLDFSHFRIGERVKLRCRLEGERWRFASLHGEHASIDEHGTVELYVHGAFQGRSGTDVAVRRTDGSLFGCSAPAELDLSYFAANEQVKLHCRLAGGGRTLLMIRSERYTVGADGSVELYAHGTLSAKTETTVTVTASDGKAFTCTFPAGLDLSRFPVGTQVKVHCHLDDGALRLEHMRSETAAVEVKA